MDAYLEAAAARQTASASSRMANAEAKESATTNTQGNSKKRKNPRGSQGVEKLKKVNVKGMAKISSFFPTKSS